MPRNSVKENKYDAIIVGAGPSGIVLAQELSKDFKILLIEKGKIGRINKAFTTSLDILLENKLQKYIISEIQESKVIYKDKEKTFKYPGATIDEKAWMEDCASKIRKNESTIKENEEVINYRRLKNGVKIYTNKGNYSSSLIIDCSGGQSVIAKNNPLHKRKYYCVVYGGIYKVPDEYAVETILGDFRMTDKVRVVEVFPHTKNTLIFYSFVYTKKYQDPTSLVRQHERDLLEYQKKYNVKLKLAKKLYGTSPIGTSRTNAIDNIFFYGDSGLSAAPIIISVFTNVLQYKEKYVGHLKKCIEEKKFDSKDLEVNYSSIEELNKDVLSGVMSTYYFGDERQFSRCIDFLFSLRSETFWDFTLMRIDSKTMIQFIYDLLKNYRIDEILSVIPRKDAKYVIQKIAEAGVDYTKLVYEEIASASQN